MFDVTDHSILARQTTQANDRIVDHNGGYRTSSDTQCKLRRVTGKTVAPRRRSPITIG
jgi:hypothetical protein